MSSPNSVMVVDDEMELANLYNEFLGRSGFNSTFFIDPLVALEHYKQHPNQYTIIIVDLCMPTLDGLRFAKRVREVDTKIKIFLMTAFYFADMFDTTEYKEVKLSGIIQKPTRLSELKLRIIESLCN